MEQTMFDAIMEMKATEKFDETILRTKALRDTWGKRLKFFTIDGNGLLWNGQKVPTIPDMYTVLEPVHKRKEKHARGIKLLRQALLEAGYVLPPFTGGCDRAINM